jgi:hypothetical protein
VEERALTPEGVAWPGPQGAAAPLEWPDTVIVARSAGSGWWGWNAGFQRVRSEWGPRAGGEANAVLSLRRGSFGRSDNALVFSRGDSAFGIGVFSEERNRRPAEAFDFSGDHLFGGSLRTLFRGHFFEAVYAGRADANKMRGGEEDRMKHEAGHAGWATRWRGTSIGARVGRGRSAQESFGTLPYSRRESQAWWADFSTRSADGRWETRGSWRRPEVERMNADAFGPRLATEWWLAARGLPLAHRADLAAAIGFGGHTGTDQTQWAPSLEWTPRRGTLAGSLWLGRTVGAVWTDLAPGQAPFTQDSWNGGVGAAWRDPEGGSGMRVDVTVGQTRSRALLARRPLAEEWMRLGARAAPEPYDFGVARAVAAWRGRYAGAGIEGQAATRDPSTGQPRVDPAHAGRAWVEGMARVFTGDLELRLRLEAEGVGPREAENGVRLPGYPQLGAAFQARIAEAVFVVRALDITEERPEQVWIDRSTGLPARAPGFEWQLGLFWRVFD